MAKRVSIYERTGTVYVVASHQTDAGFWVDDDHVVALPVSQPEEIGNAVETALGRSRENAPTPPTSKNVSESLLVAAGVTSWNIFAKIAKYVGVRQQDGIIKVTPYKNLGGKDGFVPMQDQAVSFLVGAADLKSAVIVALGRVE